MRSKSEADLSDVFVWTNTRVIKWVNSIGTFFFKNDRAFSEWSCLSRN